jgi:methyl-accepting chemotaxis protein
MITQENASSSDELTQSSDLLANLADNLNEAISYFKVDSNDLKRSKEADAKGTASKSVVTPEKSERVVKKDVSDKPAGRTQKQPENPFSNFDKDFDLDNYEKF